MVVAHLLEDFGKFDLVDQKTFSLSLEGLEDQRLESFELGYQAGWDDAVQAQADERKHVSAALSRNLKDLSFTYHEALQAFSEALRPLLEQMVTSVLPEMARASLGFNIVEQLTLLALEHGNNDVSIRVSPHNQVAVAALVNGQLSFPFTLETDVQLADGQVELSVGPAERQINTDEIANGVSDAISSFFHQTEKELKHA